MSESALKDEASDALKEHGIALLIDAVATRSAKQAVNETFFLLGVDLKDPTHVRSTRDVITKLRDDFEKSQQRKETWGKGMIHGFTTVIAGLALAVGGYLLTGHFQMPGRE